MSYSSVSGWVRAHPRIVTVVLSAVGYTLVLGTFLGAPSIYPSISRETVDVLSHAIAVVNGTALVCLVLGWRWVRFRAIRKHRLAMSTAFLLILAFLVMYLVKIGGGGTKEIDLAAGPVKTTYLGMLGVHVLLSILAVPVVIYALVLGLTYTPKELRTDTSHRRIGRLAAASWILSLLLGIVTYVLLNHVYGYSYVPS